MSALHRPRRSTTRDVRRGNRSAILRRLYLNGPISRFELSAATHLSQATVSNLVADLIAENLVIEDGLMESDGGRPRVLLAVNPEYGHVVGVDVGQTTIRVELFSLNLRQVGGSLLISLPDPRDLAHVVTLIQRGVHQILADNLVADAQVLGVGVGIPGIVEHGPEHFVHAQTLAWHQVPLSRLLAVGTTIRFFVDNGAKTMGQAELWWGAGRGTHHAAMVLIGTGVGATVISEGVTYRGTTSAGGEWGHTVICVDGAHCPCGNRGCLEAYIGAGAIIARAQAHGVALTTSDGEEAALRQLLADPSAPAQACLRETSTYLGAGLGNLINLFNPEKIIISGWAGLLLGGQLLPEIITAAGQHCLQHPFAQVSLELGELGIDAVALGAATLVVDRLLDGELSMPSAGAAYQTSQTSQSH
jgi:predicted NBD/HSP70 family sugar kinase